MEPETLLRHRGFVDGLARRLLADPERAADVAQQTWLAALERPPRYETSLRSFLARCARNVACDLGRGDARRARREAAAARPERVPSAAEVLEREHARREVVEALLRLPEPYRAVLLLRYYEDRPPRQIAAALRLPVETVRTRLKRGLARLRDELDRRHAGDRRAWSLLLVPLADAALPGAVGLLTGALVMKLVATCAGVALLVLGLVLLRDPPGEPPAPPAAGTTAAAGAEAPALARTAPPERAALAAGTADSDVTDAAAGTAPAVVVTGSVRVAGGGLVPNARVQAFRDDGGPAEDVAADATDAAGAFRLAVPADVPAVTLLVEAAGHAPHSVGGVIPGAHVDVELEVAGRLVATVVDPRDRPVAGAHVRWFGFLDGRLIERAATTDATGTAHLDDLPLGTLRGAGGVDGLGTVEVRSAEHAPLWLDLENDDAAAGATLHQHFVLMKGTTIRGIVQAAESGEPLAGATVDLHALEADLRVSGADGRRHPHPLFRRRIATARTDAGGAFVFEHAPSLGFHPFMGRFIGPEGAYGTEVAARAPGRASASTSLLLARDGTTQSVQLRLRRAARIEGRVVDAGGAPRPDVMVSADVRLQGEWTRDADRYPAPGAEVVRTDADGRYVLARAPFDQRVTVYAQAAGGFATAEARVQMEQDVTVTAPDLVLPQEPAVVLRVTRPDGTPIPGAIVAAAEVDLGGDRCSDADGRLRVVFPPKDGAPRPLRVHARGFVAHVTEPLGPGEMPPTVVPIVLRPGRALSGRVVFRTGTPAAGATVVALAAAAEGDAFAFDATGRLAATHVRTDGSFRLDGLPPEPLRLVARGRAAGPAGELPRQVTVVRDGVLAGPADVLLVLPGDPPGQPGPTLNGVVLDAATADPVLEFSVHLRAGQHERVGERIGPGRFRVRSLPSGQADLRVQAPGYQPVTLAALDLAEATRHPLTVRLGRGARMSGRVDGHAAGAGAAFVDVWDGQGNLAGRGEIQPDGRYEVTGLAAGRYMIRVTPALHYAGGPAWILDGSPIDVEVPPGASEVSRDLRVTAARSLAVRVLAPELPADATGTVTITAAGGREVVRRDGIRNQAFVIVTVPLGIYHVHGRFGAREATREVDLSAADSDGQLELDLR